MPRKSTPPTPTSAQLSPQAMRVAIPKLKRRIEDLRALDPDSFTREVRSSVPVGRRQDQRYAQKSGSGLVFCYRLNLLSLDRAYGIRNHQRHKSAARC
jgi:hypothetical protein